MNEICCLAGMRGFFMYDKYKCDFVKAAIRFVFQSHL
jgi:hypothetical protein